MSKLKDYYYALKPERTYANIMTTVAGFLFASQWHIDWLLFIYTLLGMTLIVMSACAANNCTDSKLDAKMPRTKKRATVTGSVSIRKLAGIAILFGLVGFAILAVHVNLLTCLLGAIAYIDYVVAYGWTKRTTPLSTLVGTISGSIPLVAGYTAVTGSLDTTALLLGLVMVFWQMVHFYAIAVFRREDYAAGHIPVWSVRYGVRSTQQWMLVFTVLYILTLVCLPLFASTGWVFVALMSILGLYWLYVGVKGFNVEKPEKWAKGMFGLSLIILLVFSAALSLSPKLP
jgi:protoheme IX farnesyltransferase